MELPPETLDRSRGRTSPLATGRAGNREPAEELLGAMGKSVDTAQKVFGRYHSYYAAALENYAHALKALGYMDASDAALSRAAAVRSDLATRTTFDAPSLPRAPLAPRVLDARDAARYLALGLDTLYRLVRGGELPHVRVGKSIRFRPEDLEQYLASRITRSWTRVDRRGRPPRRPQPEVTVAKA